MGKCETLIFDGYNAIHRCRFNWGGGDALSTSEDDCRLVYNFVNLLNATLSDFAPKNVIFVLDGEPTNRLKIDPTYKANREKKDLTPEEVAYWESFSRQKKMVIDFVKKLPITIMYNKNEEADDVIFSYCKSNPNQDITVISNDSDYIQIVNSCNNVKVFNPIKRVYFERTDYDYVSWKAMVGDPSDNIKGVKGVGKKTAEKIIKNGMISEKLSDEKFRTQYEHAYSLIKMRSSGVLENTEIFKGAFSEDSISQFFSECKFNSFEDGAMLESLKRNLL